MTLTLEEFREFLEWNPFHFWGLSDSEALRVTSACDTRIVQYSYQSPGGRFLGRAEIQRAIQAAEEKLSQYLGYAISPRYCESLIQWPRLRDRRLRYHGVAGIDRRWRSIQLPQGHIQAIGQERWTLVSDNVPITWIDRDGDGYLDTGTVSLGTGSFSPGELAVVFSSGDRYDDRPLDAWEIRPRRVMSSGSSISISFPRWITVRPIRYQGVTFPTLDPRDPTVFPSTIDIYRRWADPDHQGLAFWDSSPVPGGNPSRGESVPIRVGIVDAVQGIVSISPVRGTFPEPDRVFIRYVAGYPRDTYDRVSSVLREAAILLSIAEMARPICACETSNQILYHWQFDLSRTAGTESQFAIGPKTLTNPFGPRRGHVAAWERVESLRLMSAVIL